MRRELLTIQIQEAEHDLLGKHAYVAVRWARVKFEDKFVDHAIERVKSKFPDARADDIEEAVMAMDHNARIEGAA